MKYFLTITFFAFMVTHFYILRMNKKAAVKRKAFRWWLIVVGVFLTVYFSVVVTDRVLLLVVFPVLGGVLFGWLKFTKFCDWCGRMIHANLPFGDKNRCPRCGSSIS